MLFDELLNILLGQVPSLGDAGHLKVGGVGRDIGIETAARRRHKIDRNRG